MENIPKKYRGIVESARKGRSRTNAIQSHCLRCVDWLREEVRNCTDKDCFFWIYRPYGAPDKRPHRISGNGKKRQMQKRQGKKSSQRVSKSIIIKNPPQGPLRIRVEIEPEPVKG